MSCCFWKPRPVCQISTEHLLRATFASAILFIWFSFNCWPNCSILDSGCNVSTSAQFIWCTIFLILGQVACQTNDSNWVLYQAVMPWHSVLSRDGGWVIEDSRVQIQSALTNKTLRSQKTSVAKLIAILPFLCLRCVYRQIGASGVYFLND